MQQRRNEGRLERRGSTLVTVVIFYGSIRFRDSTVPVLVVFAAHGLCAIAARYAPRLGLPQFDTQERSDD